jgi:hypothetical protein
LVEFFTLFETFANRPSTMSLVERCNICATLSFGVGAAGLRMRRLLWTRSIHWPSLGLF